MLMRIIIASSQNILKPDRKWHFLVQLRSRGKIISDETNKSSCQPDPSSMLSLYKLILETPPLENKSIGLKLK